MKSTRKLWALALAVGSALFLSGCGGTEWMERHEPTTDAERKAVAEQVTAILAATPKSLAGDDQDWDDAINAAYVQARRAVCRKTYWEYKRHPFPRGDGNFTGKWRYAIEADEPNAADEAWGRTQ